MRDRIDIVPVVNSADLDAVVADLHVIDQLHPSPEWVHVDVADGKFTPHKTWNDPELWPKLKVKPKLEAHLMVEEPEFEVQNWLAAGAKRLIVHYEAIFDPRARQYKISSRHVFEIIRKACAAHEASLLLAVNPETPAGALLALGREVQGFQTLAVNPGLSGQQFLPIVLQKISFLRAHFPDATIEVDGGMDPVTIARAKAAGADTFTSESYIFRAADREAAYAALRNA